MAPRIVTARAVEGWFGTPINTVPLIKNAGTRYERPIALIKHPGGRSIRHSAKINRRGIAVSIRRVRHIH